MSSSVSEKPRIHPSFPTPSETAQNPELAYSDHLPILATVPLSENAGLCVISLNILGGVHMSGVHNPSSEETDEKITERYSRIASGLKKAINQHSVDVVMLQEADSGPEPGKEPFILPILREALGEDWEVMLPVDDRKISHGLVTCYKKSEWTLEWQKLDSKNRIHTINLRQKASGKAVNASNIWGIFEHSPVNLEKQCENTLLADQDLADVSFIIGDTNSRIAPLDAEVRNIVTGAIPLAINRENGVPQGVQTSDYPDGGFYRDVHGKIYQLQTSILCFSSGEVLDDNRSLEEVSPWLEQRMVMCLDDSFKTNKIFGEKTLFEYEAYLREKLDNDDLLVRLSADCFNHKGIGIRFPKALKEKRIFIQEYLGGQDSSRVQQLNDTQTGKMFDYLFVSIDRLSSLQDAIEAVPSLEKPATSPSSPKAKSPMRNWKRNAAFGFAISLVVIGLFTLLGFVTSGVFPFALAPLAIGFLGTATGTGLAGGIGIFTALAVVASVLLGAASALIGGLRNKFSAKTDESLAISRADETTPLLISEQRPDEPANRPTAPVHTTSLFSGSNPDDKPPARPGSKPSELSPRG